MVVIKREMVSIGKWTNNVTWRAKFTMDSEYKMKQTYSMKKSRTVIGR
jgi:hypothetical protein